MSNFIVVDREKDTLSEEQFDILFGLQINLWKGYNTACANIPEEANLSTIVNSVIKNNLENLQKNINDPESIRQLNELIEKNVILYPILKNYLPLTVIFNRDLYRVIENNFNAIQPTYSEELSEKYVKYHILKNTTKRYIVYAQYNNIMYGTREAFTAKTRYTEDAYKNCEDLPLIRIIADNELGTKDFAFILRVYECDTEEEVIFFKLLVE